MRSYMYKFTHTYTHTLSLSNTHVKDYTKYNSFRERCTKHNSFEEDVRRRQPPNPPPWVTSDMIHRNDSPLTHQNMRLDAITRTTKHLHTHGTLFRCVPWLIHKCGHGSRVRHD